MKILSLLFFLLATYSQSHTLANDGVEPSITKANIDSIAAKVTTGTSNELALKLSDYYRKSEYDPLAALGWLLFAARVGVPDGKNLLADHGKELFSAASKDLAWPLREKAELLLEGGFEPEAARAIGNAMSPSGGATVKSLGWFLLGTVLGDLESMKIVDQYYESRSNK